MFEVLLSSLLELILFLIVIFVLFVYLQTLSMETIWSDASDPLEGNPSTEDNKELAEEIDKACYKDKFGNSPEEEESCLVKGNSESTAFDKADFGNTSGKVLVENLTSDEEVFSCNEVNANSLSFSCDNYLSCSSNHSRTISPNNVENIDGQISFENTTSDENFTCDKVKKGNSIDKVNFDNADNKPVDKDINEEDSETQVNFKNTDEYFENSEETKNYIISIPKSVLLSENEAENDPFVKIVDLSNNMSKVYEVNGASFVEGEAKSRHDNEELRQYQLFQMDKTNDDNDGDMTTALDVHIQPLPQGVIINSNVFLWDAQWHTMALVDGQVFRCAICQVYCDRLTCENHVETIAHLRNMDKYKPLKKFDLSIIRKIDENLHCGVCNEIFDIIDCKMHENSKKHEKNLLTAINKVTDLMYDSNIHLAYENRKFNCFRNTSNSDRNTSTSDRLMSSSDRNTSTSGRLTSSYDRIMASSDRNTSTSDRNVPSSGRLRDGEYHFDSNAINNNIRYEDYYEEESEEEEEESEEEAEETNEEYLYEVEEYNTPSQGISYASMASKPTIELPKFLKIDLGTREVHVKFESWHMIKNLKGNNRFHCMACKKGDHVRFKSQHCIGCEHLERLAQCSVVRAFEDYLIRRVDDTLYHCGHCNNLQYQNQMEDHIESFHPKKNRNFVETSNPIQTTKKTKTTDKTPKTVIEPKKTESDKSAIVNKNLGYNDNTEYSKTKIEPPKIDPNFDIFGDVSLTPFGCQLKIPALNFNLIMKTGGDYYCVICDKVCADVKVHVEEMEHVELMTMTPFIKYYQNHLTRAVLGMFHCSICNELFPVKDVDKHNIDQPHTTALAAAMGMKKSQKPTNTKRITTLNLGDQNDAQNSTQFPALTVKNTLSFNVPLAQTAASNLINQKENVKPVSLNQLIEQVSVQKTNIQIPEMAQNTPSSHPGQNGAAQKVFDAPSVISRLNTQMGQNCKSNGQGLMKLLKIGQNSGQNSPNHGLNLPHPGQNLPTPRQNMPNLGLKLPNPGQNLSQAGQHHPNLLSPGQNMPNSGQNLPNPGQNLPNPGLNLPHPGQNLPYPEQNLPNPGQHMPNPGQNLPYFGQSLPNFGQNQPVSGQHYPFPPNLSIQTIKSTPPMFNSMFPQFPPVNSQNLKNQFMEAPLVYNNTPRPSVSPFRNLTPNDSPNLLSPNAPVQNNQEVERKTIIITDRNETVSGNGNSKSRNDNTRRDSDNSRPGSRNIRRDSDNSRPGSTNIRRDSENSRPGSRNIRRDSDNSKPGSRTIRRDSVNSKTGSDNSKPGNDNSKSGYENSRSGNDNMESDSLSEVDEYKEFDEEEMVFIKLKTTYFKITNMSYNSLVFLDNGTRYCFVCWSVVYMSQQQKHVESRKHLDCLADNKFLDKYGVQLFRQMYLMYHCAICNELMTRKEIKLHLDWSVHIENYNVAHLILNKKNRKELKSGLKEYVVETQKEAIFHNVNEPNYHVRAAYQIVPNSDGKKDAPESKPAKGSSVTVKKNKMVIQDNVVMKIPFEHWHGITNTKNVTKCIICQIELTQDEVLEHVETDYHAVGLGKTFEKTPYSALIRKINEETVNCMTCNLELPNSENMILEHASGRRHAKYREDILRETTKADSYDDCLNEYLNV